MPRYDFFVSHHQDDAGAEASLLAETLRNQGFRVFLDVDTHQVGDLEQLTRKALEESKGVIVFVGPNFGTRIENNRDWVRLELEAAHRARKEVLPLVLPNAEASLRQLPDSLAWFGRTRWLRFDRSRVAAVVEEVTSAFRVRARASTGPGTGWLILMIMLAILLGMAIVDSQRKTTSLEVERTLRQTAEKRVESLEREVQELRIRSIRQ
jgi:hypothetical protein